MVLALYVPAVALNRAVLSVTQLTHEVLGFRIHLNEPFIRDVIRHRFICESVEFGWVNTFRLRRRDIVRQNVLHAKQAMRRIDRHRKIFFKLRSACTVISRLMVGSQTSKKLTKTSTINSGNCCERCGKQNTTLILLHFVGDGIIYRAEKEDII